MVKKPRKLTVRTSPGWWQDCIQTVKVGMVLTPLGEGLPGQPHTPAEVINVADSGPHQHVTVIAKRPRGANGALHDRLRVIRAEHLPTQWIWDGKPPKPAPKRESMRAARAVALRQEFDAQIESLGEELASLRGRVTAMEKALGLPGE